MTAAGLGAVLIARPEHCLSERLITHRCCLPPGWLGCLLHVQLIKLGHCGCLFLLVGVCTAVHSTSSGTLLGLAAARSMSVFSLQASFLLSSSSQCVALDSDQHRVCRYHLRSQLAGAAPACE